MESMSPDNAAEVRTIRKWFLVALLLSLALHGGLYLLLKTKHLDHFTFTPATPRLVPRAFTVKKVVIPENLLKPAATPDPKKAEPPKTIIPNEKPPSEPLADVRFTPNTPSTTDLNKAISADRPRVEPGKIGTPETNAQIEREINSIREALATKNAPKIVAGQDTGLPESHPNGTGGFPGYSNLDELVTQSAPLIGKVAPIYQQGGALFEYDSATLRKEAIETLSKLGILIERNPRATFSIEGYTDSFGTPEYNQKLSTARAEAVKSWLVTYMKVDPAKIQAKGLGSANLKIPATSNREQQAPNRRVEIVITTPKD